MLSLHIMAIVNMPLKPDKQFIDRGAASSAVFVLTASGRGSFGTVFLRIHDRLSAEGSSDY